MSTNPSTSAGAMNPTRTSSLSAHRVRFGTIALKACQSLSNAASSLSRRITTEIPSARTAMSPHRKHLHHLVAEVVDDLDRNAARFGFRERARGGATQALPSFLVDLGFQCGF